MITRTRTEHDSNSREERLKWLAEEFACECAIVLRKTTVSKSSIQITVDSKFSELANYAEAMILLSDDIAAHHEIRR